MHCRRIRPGKVPVNLLSVCTRLSVLFCNSLVLPFGTAPCDQQASSFLPLDFTRHDPPSYLYNRFGSTIRRCPGLRRISADLPFDCLVHVQLNRNAPLPFTLRIVRHHTLCWPHNHVLYEERSQVAPFCSCNIYNHSFLHPQRQYPICLAQATELLGARLSAVAGSR